MNENERPDSHGRFKELAALANSGALNTGEEAELKSHLQVCESCLELYEQYRSLATRGIPLLAATYSRGNELQSWDDSATRRKLFARIRASDGRPYTEPYDHEPFGTPRSFFGQICHARLVQAALAACVLIVAGVAIHHLRRQAAHNAHQVAVSAEDRFQKLAVEKGATDELLLAQTAKLMRLQQDRNQKEQEITQLKSKYHALEIRSEELSTNGARAEVQLQALSQEREALKAHLRDAEVAGQHVQAELASLRSEHEQDVLQNTSLESRLDQLTAANRDQQSQIKDDEQYLASDRDIRELMGARRLYIADVFDVDSGSRTQKPFGRVFYTQGKSLIFYAFDLDARPGLKNASTFQVWGKKETAQGEQARPMNLGILYMDNEKNRRWVMRFDDPKQLAEIDAVFVTVEPHGGSPKPTTKPFLYALLRKEVNHP
jgi:Anti-sigma-K factor rskA, C-terminal